jgi:hypothetical protein
MQSETMNVGCLGLFNTSSPYMALICWSCSGLNRSTSTAAGESDGYDAFLRLPEGYHDY